MDIRAKVTIFLPVTRKDRIDVMAEQINRLENKYLDINILMIVDNKDIDVDIADKFIYPATIINTGNNPPSEHNIAQRRKRIANVWQLAQDNISDTDMVFCLEDDTDFEPDALMNLVMDIYSLLEHSVKTGFVSGLQAGRWGYKIIGAWKADNSQEPTTLETIPYTKDQLLTAVDAAGFYCCLMPLDAFRQANDLWHDGDNFGPDVNFGLKLRKAGYRNFVDWSVQCGHNIKEGKVIVDEKCIVVKYIKENNEWKRTHPKT